MSEHGAQERPTARHILVGWANSQDNWVRAIVAEVLSNRSDLPDATINRLYRQFLAEKELSDDNFPQIGELALGGNEGDHSEELALVSMRGVENVNALLAGEQIEFNPRLTVLLGENASGKTGYVRVLKSIAAVRGSEPVLSNVWMDSSAALGALLIYTHGGTETELHWRGETGIAPLNRMSIFDSRAVSIHVDEDLAYVYTPKELALFAASHHVIEAIKGRLDQQCTDARPRENPFLVRFDRNTIVYTKIESLGPSTEFGTLEELARTASVGEEQLSDIRNRIEALRSQSVDAQLRVARADSDFYGSALASISAFLATDWDQYAAKKQAVHVAQEREKVASQEAFSGENIPEVLTDSWIKFIQAGEEYTRHVTHTDYPTEGQQCIYCRQVLNSSAVFLVRKYREYTSSLARQQVKDATDAMHALSSTFANVDFRSLEGEFNRRKEDRAFLDAPVTKNSASVIEGLSSLQARVLRDEAIDTEDLIGQSGAAGKLLKEALSGLKELISTLSSRAAERERVLNEESAKLRNLEAGVLLRRLLPEIKAYLDKIKWISRASVISNRLPSVLRSVTEASKVASEQLLNEDFERLFIEECEALRAPKRVRLDFPGRSGQPRRRKVLAPGHGLSEVLSEGEQKVIALADFLAEARIPKVSTPIVFDDPVTSLDHRRLQYVVDRIVGLAEDHQVIIFTHDILFAVGLLAKFEHNTSNCSYYDVSASEGAIGVITAGTHPRWDTVAKIRGRINGIISQAAREAGEVQQALIEQGYSSIRAWCEVVTEAELLAGVAQRYQPHIAMTKLSQIKSDRLAAARNVIIPIFEKACRMTEAHSQPLATLAVRATLGELNVDWKALQDARDEYLRQ